MLTVSLMSQKGGTGKTTLAVALAVASERNGRRAAVIDLDPQGSALAWRRLRKSPKPVIAAAIPTKLYAVRQAAKRAGAELLIIDTAPHAEDAAIERAANIADIILIPCRPSGPDINAIGETVSLARRSERAAAFTVINSAPVKNPLTEQARAAIARYGIETAPVVIHQRIDHVHGFTDGRSAEEVDPKSKAAREIRALYDWLTTAAATRP